MLPADNTIDRRGNERWWITCCAIITARSHVRDLGHASHPNRLPIRICFVAPPPSGIPCRIAFPRRSGAANWCGKGVVRDELAAPIIFTRS